MGGKKNDARLHDDDDDCEMKERRGVRQGRCL